jgi:hypothetical protein
MHILNNFHQICWPIMQIFLKSVSGPYVDLFQVDVIPFILNYSNEKSLVDLVENSLIIKLAQSVKLIYSKSIETQLYSIRLDCITILVNFAVRLKYVRSHILGDDLLQLIERAGNESQVLNAKYVALISIISCEENCCIKLIDSGIQKLFVSLQGSH